MKRLIVSACAVAFCAIVSTAQSQNDYTVTLPLTADEDGLTAYIVSFDTGNKIDSTTVTDAKAVFKGTVAAPEFARIILDGNRAGMFILEPGKIDMKQTSGTAVGTPTNDALTNLFEQQKALEQQFRALPKDATEQQGNDIRDKYMKLTQETFQNNLNNPLGYYLFLQNAYSWDLNEFEQNLAKYPQFASSKRINTLKQGLVNKEETSVGHKFKDFEITYNGETKRLSDFVGKGKYTLVDFWASWCGPCIRETAVIKKLYEKYVGKGLDFLGVAVWDEPANTLAAIEKHALPWPQILNAKTIPTDIYGIAGIPCIILFDPEGNIVSRDKQDEELIADVDAAMATKASKQ